MCRVADLGWHVQIHLRADQIVAAESLWSRLPSTIVFDHMGRLRGMKDGTSRLDKTIALAKYPNVHVKLTLISECSSAEYPYKNIQPEVRRLIDAFSPRRSFNVFCGCFLAAFLGFCEPFTLNLRRVECSGRLAAFVPLRSLACRRLSSGVFCS